MTHALTSLSNRIAPFLNPLILIEIVTHSTLGREPSKVELCQLSSVSLGRRKVAVDLSFQLMFVFPCFGV